MKQAIFTLLFCLSAGIIFGQAVGDYRSRINGNWNGPSAWEVFFNGAWRPVHQIGAGPFQNVIPSSSSGVITVRHNISITSSIGINQTVIQAPAQLRINAGVVLTLNDDFTTTPLQISANAILVNAGTLDLQSQLTSTPCQVFGEIYSTGLIQISNGLLLSYNSGSRYIQANASSVPVPPATWHLSSILIISGLNSPNPSAPSNLGQSFGIVIWDTPALGGNVSLGGTLTNVRGSLILANTGGRQVRLSDDGLAGYNLVIGVNLVVQTGQFILTQSQTSPTSITIGGSFLMTSGNLTLGITNNSPIDIFVQGNFTKPGGNLFRGSGTGSATFRFSGGGPVQTYGNNAVITTPVNFSVETGSSLHLGTQFLAGPGTFTLNSGASLLVGSTDPLGAIQNSGSAGNIRNTGLRTYQNGSTIIYNGLGHQFIGTGQPSNTNVTINNVNSVSLVSNLTISGDLHLLNGVLLIHDRTLTLNGQFSYTNGFFGISALSNMVVNGSGISSNLVLAPVQSQFPPNQMNNLTINRIGGTVSLGLDLIIGGTFTHTNGTFLLGQAPGWSLTLRGPFIRTAGTFSLFDNPILIIEGAGALPSDVIFTGSGLEQLTMNRPGATFTTTSPLLVDSLNLFNGIVNNPLLNITMYSDGLVTRRAGGTISQVLNAQSSYDVLYDASTDITTGNELPLTIPLTTQLGNLSKEGVGAVTLNKDIVVNGTFTIEEGTFDAGVGNAITIVRNFTVDGTFVPQQGTVTFSGGSPQTISGGPSPISFFDLAVSQTASSSLNIVDSVDVEHSLSVTSPSTVNSGNQFLTLISNATNTAYVAPLNAGAAIEGTVIAQRHLPNNDGVRAWRYITPTVTGSFVSDWKTEMTITGTFSDPSSGPGIISSSASMYIYDEPSGAFDLNNGYQPYPTSGASSAAPLINGKGYSVFGRTNGQIIFDSRGRLGQGDVPVSVVNSATGPDSGWNLIGNPYPAPIDWDNVSIPAGVNNAVYIYDNANNANNGVGFVSYVGGVSSPASFQGEIASGQAFFVRATGNATITFQENDKIIDSETQFYRERQISNLMRITLSGQDKTDETVLRLHENATDLFDNQYDAFKLPNPSLNLMTRTTDNLKLVINSVSSLDCNKTIPLVIEGAIAGSYNLNFSGIETFYNSPAIFLFDKLTNEKVDLHKTTKYSFNLTETNQNELNNRFEIVMAVHEDVEPANISQEGTTLISNYENGNQWYLDGVAINNETSSELTAVDPGTYTLKVNLKGCAIAASSGVKIGALRENSIDDIIKIYPNPTSDKITVEVASQSPATVVKLMSPLGIELNSMDLNGVDRRSGQFDLSIYPQGVYLLRIYDGQFFYTKKVSKIE